MGEPRHLIVSNVLVTLKEKKNSSTQETGKIES